MQKRAAAARRNFLNPISVFRFKTPVMMKIARQIKFYFNLFFAKIFFSISMLSSFSSKTFV